MPESIRGFIQNKDFVNKLSSIEEYLDTVLKFWQVHSPHYTDHGKDHCQALERNLDEMIPYTVKSSMNQYEIFLLLSAVSLHDIGIMQACSSDEEKTEIRDNHHERSRNFVVNHFQGLLVASERYMIGQICYAHRHSVPLSEVEEKKIIRHPSVGNQEIRLQFLAALLRMADCCDLCFTRTVEGLAEMTKMPEEASFYHNLHERVSGLFFDGDNKTIKIDFNITNISEERICREHVVQDIEKHLQSVKDCLIKNGVIYLNVSPSFSLSPVITTPLNLPEVKKKSEIPEKDMELIKQHRLQQTIYRMIKAEKIPEAIAMIDKELSKNETAFMYNLKGLAYKEIDDYQNSAKFYVKASDLEQKNSNYATLAGHILGEFLFDFENSYIYLERAYQNNPNDSVTLLNYAEGLASVKKYQEAYNIADKLWNTSRDIYIIMSAQFIRAYTLYLLGKTKEANKEIKAFVNFYFACPIHINELISNWVFNKIQKLFEKEIKNVAILDCLIKTSRMIQRIGSEEECLETIRKIEATE